MRANETTKMLESIGTALDITNDLLERAPDKVTLDGLNDVVVYLHRSCFMACKLAQQLREREGNNVL